jgi:hypothetical protein
MNTNGTERMAGSEEHQNRIVRFKVRLPVGRPRPPGRR